MWFKTQGPASPLFLWIAMAGVLWAQQGRTSDVSAHRTVSPSPAQPDKKVANRFLSFDEGLTVLGAALESRHQLYSRLDCSHLVHAIYEKSGFPYTYASSSELYDGVSEFQRVAHPQTGDLVVWPGHVGIVISPRQRSFFSFLRSGRGVEPYDSKYWQMRGRPRFYRYVKPMPAPVFSAAKRDASLQLMSLRNGGSSEPTPTLPESEPEKPRTDEVASGLRGRAAPTNVAIPRSQVVHSSRPGTEQLNVALRQVFENTARALRDADIFKLTQSLVVFDNLEVHRVQLKRHQGWAEVRVTGASAITEAAAEEQKHLERQHWGMTRLNSGSWELALPPDTIYLPRVLAVQVLAHQLATLSDTNNSRRAKGEKKNPINATPE